MNKAIFLDRDGTINIDKNYLSDINEFEYVSGAIEGLKLLQKAGFFLLIITNQSGIARGYYDEENFLKLNTWMINDLKNKGICITKVYYCPHLPNAVIEKYRVDCDCRKPKLGLYNQAIEEFGIDLVKSYAIGDKIRDLSLCEKTKCNGYLISNSEKDEIIINVKNGKFTNIKYADNLLEAAKKIVGGN